MCFKHRYHSILLLLLAVTGQLAAQTYRSTVYLEEDGLLSSHVTDIAQATDGSIWFATIEGVSQYDGVFWNSFPSSEYNLPHTRETQLISIDNGRLILAGHNGKEFSITEWNGNEWQPIPLIDPIKIIGHSSFAFDVWADGDELKIAVGNNTIFEYSDKRKTWEEIPYAQKIGVANYTRKLKYDYKGTLWAGTIEGLKKRTGKSWESVPIDPSSTTKEPIIQSIAFQKNDTIPYILSPELIGTWENNTFKTIIKGFVQNSRFNTKYFYLAFNNKNELFFSHNSPAYIVQDSTFKPLYFNDALLFAWCSAIVPDREDNLWIATERGAIKLAEYSFRSYESGNGFFEDEVSAIKELADGTLILGSNHSFSTIEDDIIETFPTNRKQELNNRRILRIIEDDDGALYFASNINGLGIWNRKSKNPKWILPSSAPLATINEIFKFNNKLHVISYNTIYQLNSDLSFTKVYEHPGFIRKVQTLADGNTYLISDDILLFHGKGTQPLYKLSSNRKEAIYGICNWKGQTLVATLEGLQVVDNNQIKPYNLDTRLNTTTVYALFVDSKKNLWIGTSLGVFHLVGEKLNHYSRSNGLIGNEINRNALIEDRDGNIWIGTDRGVSVFSYSRGLQKKTPPLLNLKSIITNKGQDIKDASTITLAHNENTLEFGFIGVSFIDERNVSYRYRLLGFDEEWSVLPYNQYPFVRYTNLPYGSYKFEVQTRRDEEEWTNSVYSGQININRPFYQTPFFLIFVVLLIAAIGYIVNMIIVQHKNQRFLRRKIKEKVSEIATSEKMLIEKNKQLQQLNGELDRFVYGVSHDLKAPLNSMKGLLQVSKFTNDEQEKEEMLDMMDRNIDRLKDFIGSLETYTRNQQKAINAEKIAFNTLITECINTLKFSSEAKEIELTHQVSQWGNFYSDRNRINVILSNLLSNAIRYRNHRDEPPHVKVLVESTPDQTILKVKDNGIGISASLIEKVFDMFERGETQQQGSSGLGLFIVKETVDKLKGEITVESKEKVGTTFTVTLPSLKKK